MDYINKLKNKINDFEKQIPTFFSGEKPWEKEIQEAMLYSLNAGGKRIRPLLLMEIASAYGTELEKSLTHAMALEMIHTYSLIHDDLPCMDNDDLRRGKPTNHIVYGEDIAVLAGDALLNRAYEIMIESCIAEPELIYATQTIAKAAGAEGMILGQVADIKNSENHTLTQEMLDYINANKTGRLITAALVAGAQVSGQFQDVALMRSIGYQMGLMFQMKDDILDMIGDKALLGKSTQNDEKNNKCTYPQLIGIDATEKRIQDMRDKVLAQIRSLSTEQLFLEETVNFFVDRSY